jgi:hypothetical protein
MKSLYSTLLLLCCAGCMPQWVQPDPPKPAPVVKTPALVTPDSVTAANAHEKCDALANEMERAENAH